MENTGKVGDPTPPSPKPVSPKTLTGIQPPEILRKLMEYFTENCDLSAPDTLSKLYQRVGSVAASIPRSNSRPPPMIKIKQPNTPQAPLTPSPKKKPKPKPKKSITRTQSSYFEKRSIILINESEIKRIQTPDVIESVDFPPNDPVPDFNIVENHSRLEMCEYRIINGIDKRYGHPANAIQASESEKDLNPKPFEIEKVERYDEIEIVNRTPLFWEPRVWDTENTMMSEKASELLEQKIAEVNEMSRSLEEYPENRRDPSAPQTPRKVQMKHKVVKKTNKQKKQRETIVSLSTYCYDTDDEDFYTDCDMF